MAKNSFLEDNFEAIIEQSIDACCSSCYLEKRSK